MEIIEKANYYALFLAIVNNETATQALIDMGISPDSETNE